MLRQEKEKESWLKRRCSHSRYKKRKWEPGLSKELLMGSVSVSKQRPIHAAPLWSHVTSIAKV